MKIRAYTQRAKLGRAAAAPPQESQDNFSGRESRPLGVVNEVSCAHRHVLQSGFEINRRRMFVAENALRLRNDFFVDLPGLKSSTESHLTAQEWLGVSLPEAKRGFVIFSEDTLRHSYLATRKPFGLGMTFRAT